MIKGMFEKLVQVGGRVKLKHENYNSVQWSTKYKYSSAENGSINFLVTNQIRLKASFDLNEIALGTKGSFAKIPPL